MNLALMILYAVLAVGDVWSTNKALKMGGVEAAPIPRALFKIGPPVVIMAALKLLGAGLFYYGIYGAASEPWHEYIRWPIMAVLYAGAVWVLVSNLRFIRRNSRP